MAVYFFYGDEEFNIELEINKFKKNLDSNFAELSYKTYDNPKFADLTAIIRSQPLMFGKLLIVIKCNKYFEKAFEDNELKELESDLNNVNENLDIIFLAQLPRNENKKLDSRKKFYKLISKFNPKEFASIPSYKTSELEFWIKKQAKSKAVNFEPDAIIQLITQVGNNLRELNDEIEKLKLFIYPRNTISKKDVLNFSISNEDLFNFSDYIMKGEFDSALLEYRKLLDKKYPLEIIAALQTMVRKWIILKAKSSECSATELSRLTGQHEYVVKLSLQKLKNTSLKDLVKLKQELTNIEFKIKTGNSLEPEKEFENIFFTIKS